MEVTADEVEQADVEEAEPSLSSMGHDRWINQLCPHLKGRNWRDDDDDNDDDAVEGALHADD